MIYESKLSHPIQMVCQCYMGSGDCRTDVICETYGDFFSLLGDKKIDNGIEYYECFSVSYRSAF
jgi:hypothetical protein